MNVRVTIVTIADLCPATQQMKDLPDIRCAGCLRRARGTEMQMSMPIVRRIH